MSPRHRCGCLDHCPRSVHEVRGCFEVTNALLRLEVFCPMTVEPRTQSPCSSGVLFAAGRRSGQASAQTKTRQCFHPYHRSTRSPPLFPQSTYTLPTMSYINRNAEWQELNAEFDLCTCPKIHVYCDGAASNNGYDGAKAGWGVYFEEPDWHYRNAGGPVIGKQTNQRAELKVRERRWLLSSRPWTPD